MLQRAFNARARASRTEIFPAPTGGWMQSGNITVAQPNEAEVLDNFIPTAQGARLRGGASEFADLGAACVRMFVYADGATETLFAATATDIFDASDVGSGAVRTSLTSGDWSTQQIGTTGGRFLVGVNGADTGWTYNGSTFSNISLTGVTSSDLSQVWLFKRRLFFVEDGTSSVWYLPVDSIGGTVTELDLGAVFQEGGAVLFGATWSLDSGSGLDDVCIFVSDRGEIAVYEGTDPDSASTWSLVGVYKIGAPLNKHAFFKAGGDLAILTEDGIIPVSEALRKDRGALQAGAISAPIEDAWKDAIANRTSSYPISATLWQAQTLLLVGTPATEGAANVSFVANARTGRWGRITGWDVRCAAVFGDDLYFGNNAGLILKADTGGTDNGTQYIGTYVPKFSNSEGLRTANAAAITYRCSEEVTFNLHAHGDYQVDQMSPPTVATTASTSAWGSGVWGTFVWGGGQDLNSYTEWQTVRANGYALAPAIVIASNQTAMIQFEIMSMRLRSESGYAL